MSILLEIDCNFRYIQEKLGVKIEKWDGYREEFYQKFKAQKIREEKLRVEEIQREAKKNLKKYGKR